MQMQAIIHIFCKKNRFFSGGLIASLRYIRFIFSVGGGSRLAIKNSLRSVQNQLIFIQEGRASGVGGGGSGWKQLFQDPAVNQRRVLHRVHGRFFR